MIIIFSIWVLSFLIIYLIGFSAQEFYVKYTKSHTKLKFDEIYFTGFIFTSVIASYFSIIVPLNYISLGVICFYSICVFIINRKKIVGNLNNLITNFKSTNLLEIGLLLFTILILAASSSSEILHYDTGLYHTQSIKWIREYAVVPGLGNLQNRFALNPMFFPISAIFTVDTSEFINSPSILIYPLNAISLIVLLFKQYIYIKENLVSKNWGHVFFGITISFLSLLLFTKYVSSPSPDIISGILIIYLIQQLIQYKNESLINYNFILIATLLFQAVTYKLSSLLLLLFIIPLLTQKNWLNKISLVSIIGLLIFIPFIVRNYYLSGYLLYPFHSIDIFNVDWKCSIESVINIENWIEAKAKIPYLAPDESYDPNFTNWFRSWFSYQSSTIKPVLVLNALTIIYLVNHIIIRKFNRLFSIQLIIIVNLIFLLIMAPVPRFAYGFIIAGAALFIFNLSLTLNQIKYSNKFLSSRLALLILCLGLSGMIVIKNKNWVMSSIKNPARWIIPSEMETIETIEHQTNFTYYSPIRETKCFNTKLPCTPYPNENLVLRKNEIKDGFEIKKDLIRE